MSKYLTTICMFLSLSLSQNCLSTSDTHDSNPWESWRSQGDEFNDTVDTYTLKPVFKGLSIHLPNLYAKIGSKFSQKLG